MDDNCELAVQVQITVIDGNDFFNLVRDPRNEDSQATATRLNNVLIKRALDYKWYSFTFITALLFTILAPSALSAAQNTFRGLRSRVP